MTTDNRPPESRLSPPGTTRTINVLQITSSLQEHGGIEETLRILCRKLDPRQFRVGICSIVDSPDDVPPDFKRDGVSIYCLGRKGYFFDIFTTLAVKKTIRHFEADIVHTHRNKANLHGRLAALLNRTRTVTTFHAILIFDGPTRDFFTRGASLKKTNQDFTGDTGASFNPVNSMLHPLFTRILNRFTGRIIAVSETVRALYCKDKNNARYTTVYAPYDEEIFTPDSRKPFTSKEITIGTVGRLVWKKGHGYLLSAMRDIHAIRQDIRLKIIGDGPLRSELQNYIDRHELAACVELCGSRPHGAHLYDNIDIYVQPSVSEGCSITLLEAMGCGIPVIASNIDGPAELIRNGVDGILVPARDPCALKNAILDLIEHQEKAAALAKDGYTRACRNFSSRHFTDSMTALYRSLITARIGRRPEEIRRQFLTEVPPQDQ